MVGPLRFALAGVLSGLVMADDAARACSEQPVVTGKVPRNAADYGPLQAALAGAGVELSARPVTATAKAAGSSIAFI
jgi:hypothetical protein